MAVVLTRTQIAAFTIHVKVAGNSCPCLLADSEDLFQEVAHANEVRGYGGLQTYVCDALGGLTTLTPPAAFHDRLLWLFIKCGEASYELTRPNNMTRVYSYDNLSQLAECVASSVQEYQ